MIITAVKPLKAGLLFSFLDFVLTALRFDDCPFLWLCLEKTNCESVLISVYLWTGTLCCWPLHDQASRV